MKSRILSFRNFVVLAIAIFSLSAMAAPSIEPSYTVEHAGMKAVVQLTYDAAESVLTARIQREGQPDHVYVYSLAQLKLDVSIGTDRLLTVQGHTSTRAGYIESADLSVGEEITPSQIWQLRAARELRTTLGADIDIFGALPNRDLMNVFIGPYVLTTGDMGRVLAHPREPFQVTTPPGIGGRFNASSDVHARPITQMPIVDCSFYGACYWGCVAGGGGWIDCGGYCHDQYGC